MSAPARATRRRRRPDVIAVINSTPDAVDMLRLALTPLGAAIVSAYTYDIRDGLVDLAAFMQEHRPGAIVYDVAPPYDQNWTLLQHLRRTPAMRRVPLVITSTNAEYVQALAGRDEQIYEVVGRPDDLERIVRATKEALRVRPTR